MQATQLVFYPGDNMSLSATPNRDDTVCNHQKNGYNYALSTEENWAVCFIDNEVPPMVGKYQRERQMMDYTYHKYYSPERQILQDKLMDLFHDTIVYDTDHNLICDRPLENWLVFTAGAMGAGKGRTMHWLAQQGLFPLSAFVKVDPDSLRELLPETREYIARNPATAGRLTQKEVGYVAEILSMDALHKGKNVLVDGTLRDAAWYSFYIQSLRAQFPRLKFAIIHVTASEATVIQRAEKRAERTGRLVPKDVILETMEQIPNSLKVLSPFVNFIATFDNEGDEPVLQWSSSNVLSHEMKVGKEVDSRCGHHTTIYSAASCSAQTSDFSSCKDKGSRPLHVCDWWDSFRDMWKMECAIK